MTATLLITLNIEDPSTLLEIASDIEDELINTGFDVISVVPWKREVLTGVNSGSFIPTQFPTQPPLPFDF